LQSPSVAAVKRMDLSIWTDDILWCFYNLTYQTIQSTQLSFYYKNKICFYRLLCVSTTEVTIKQKLYNIWKEG
jgi:hypothetical protein